jgi:hypothetical protein
MSAMPMKGIGGGKSRGKNPDYDEPNRKRLVSGFSRFQITLSMK